MSPAADWLDVLIAVSLVLTAALALLAPGRVAGGTAFLVLGVLLAITWARLDAPDIALAEAVIASGITGALLVAALTGRLGPPAPTRRSSATTALAVVAGAALVALPVGLALLATDRPTRPDDLAPSAQRALDDAAVDHPITVVLLEYRAYDTLLEVAVLAIAALVALSLHRDGALAAVEDPTDTRSATTGLVAVVAPVALLLTGWLLVAGSTRPGGAFQAGAMLTGLLLLLHLNGRRPRLPTGRALRPLVMVGLLVFIVLGAGTAVTGGRWLAITGPQAGTVIVLLEAILAVSIGVALAALVLAGRPDRRESR